MKIILPEKVNRILKRLQDAGYEAYAVGGCVRDSLLGRTPHDWDITTSALPEEVKELFARTIDTGLKHGTVTVLMDREQFEVTTYRIDGAYADGRHPDKVTFSRSLEEDLKRRDFTINAMAYNDADGVVDLFDGLGDIERKQIRAVGEPSRRFEEDVLRIMRAVRFSAQLGYEIEGRTEEAIRDHAPQLTKISAERIRDELIKLLVSPCPEKLADLYRLGITKVILPEFDACMDCDQDNPHHQYSVGEHIIRTVCAIRPDPVLRLTMLLHDIGKPVCLTTDEDGIDHFYGHDAVSAEMAERILRRLKLDNQTIRTVVRLVRYHDMDIRMTGAGVRKAVFTVGEDVFPLLLEVMRADVSAKSEATRIKTNGYLDDIQAIYDEILERGDCLGQKDLAVNGKDLILCGVKPGREMGDILDRMLQDVLREPSHNSREYLLGTFLPGGAEKPEKP